MLPLSVALERHRVWSDYWRSTLAADRALSDSAERLHALMPRERAAASATAALEERVTIFRAARDGSDDNVRRASAAAHLGVSPALPDVPCELERGTATRKRRGRKITPSLQKKRTNRNSVVRICGITIESTNTTAELLINNTLSLADEPDFIEMTTRLCKKRTP